MTNFERFVAEYERQLTLAVQKYPQEYGYGTEKVPEVARKMTVAFKEKSYNKDGRAIKATCKTLGIPYTYKGINQYLEN